MTPDQATELLSSLGTIKIFLMLIMGLLAALVFGR